MQARCNWVVGRFGGGSKWKFSFGISIFLSEIQSNCLVPSSSKCSPQRSYTRVMWEFMENVQSWASL